MPNARAILSSVADDIRFFKSWAESPSSIGSIKPTSKAACRLMVGQIPKNVLEERGQVLELGPGTGVVTASLLDAGYAPGCITSVEYNAPFFSTLRNKHPSVNFVHGDAFALEETLGKSVKGRFGAVLSGIPLLNFPKSARSAFIEGGLEMCAPGAPFIQLCYGPRPPVLDKAGSFKTRPSKWVLTNVPPARFWIYEKS